MENILSILKPNIIDSVKYVWCSLCVQGYVLGLKPPNMPFSEPLYLPPQGLCTCWCRVFVCAYSYLDVLTPSACMTCSFAFLKFCSNVPLQWGLPDITENSNLNPIPKLQTLLSLYSIYCFVTRTEFLYLLYLMSRLTQRAQKGDKVFVFVLVF